VDFNRSGVPLMEIVTEPDIRTAEQARRYAEELQLLLRSLGASDADMERGQLRVEANVSLRPRGTEAFGTRVEVKNMNSFRSVEHAVAFEIERQAAALDAGEALHMETRGWADDRGETYHMRSKETSDDYRYFPEPDLPPLRVDAAWLAQIRAELPELPAARRARYRDVLGLSAYDAAVLVADADAGRLFEATLAAGKGVEPKPVANWVTGDYLRIRNAAEGPITVDPAALAALVALVGEGSLNRSSARQVLDAHVSTGEGVDAIVARLGLKQISDADALGRVVDEVIAANPDAVADVRAGKAQAIGFLVGQVMKATRGQANAAVAQAALRERLEAGEQG
jgi:aspartyl-tRNA(Asn)/glutamyl-tRNA(Gln) amidotransferase subunit B